MRDYIFKRLLFLCSLLVLLICGGMVYSLVSGAVPAFEKFGFFHFISSVEWDPRPGNEQYGALAFITGTIMTSFLALVFCIPFSLPVALFTGEYFRGTRAATIIGSVIDLLAGIPSIVYGLWGFYTLRPFMVDLQLSEQGFGIFTAAVVLAVMIIPYASSLS
ncbi:MAG TPA: phosphate ABC transporter permease subunit PstC, partial [Odoribacter splanchnicus]|nr:phosphate ABC transporter permease subunit PstC [Odoribacter splanchnicus]